MTLSIYADPWTTAEMSNAAKYQGFTPSIATSLRYVRIAVVLFNDPTFTSLSGELYSDNAGVPNALIATSTNTVTKADLLISKINGWKECYFQFADLGLTAAVRYHVVINASGYTYSTLSHLAWCKSFPRRLFGTTYTNVSEVQKAPYHMAPIWSEF